MSREFSRLALFNKYEIFENSYESLQEYIVKLQAEHDAAKKSIEDYCYSLGAFGIPMEISQTMADMQGTIKVLDSIIRINFTKVDF